MNEFEELLRRALSKKEPPPGFSSRIEMKMSARRRHHFNWREILRQPLFPMKIRWAAAGLIVILLLGLGYRQYQNHRRARMEGEWAKEQLVVALRITNEKLAAVQKKLPRLENREVFVKVEQ